MSNLVQAVASVARGQVPPGRVAFLWTVHQGIRGATELQVLGDGTVTEGPMLGDPTFRGTVPVEEVHRLAATLDRLHFHEMRAAASSRPGATIVTLDVHAVGEGFRLEVPSGTSSPPGFEEIRDAFLSLRRRAEQPPAPASPLPGRPGKPAREVQLSGSYWTTMGCLAPLTFGMTVFIGWWTARSFPREYDDEGLTTRAGRRYRWSELRPIPIVNANRPGVVLGYHLAGNDDSLVRLAPFSLVDGKAVCQELLARAGGAAGALTARRAPESPKAQA